MPDPDRKIHKKSAIDKYKDAPTKKVGDNNKPRTRRPDSTDSIDGDGLFDESGHRKRGKNVRLALAQSEEGGDRRTPRKRKVRSKKVREVVIPDAVTVSGLADLIHVRLDHLQRVITNMGMGELHHDYMLTPEDTTAIVLEFDINPIITEDKGKDVQPRDLPDDMSEFPLRPPVVTIMGHVDHGKTTLLDTLRKSSIVDSEAGGITQHIGAFAVTLPSGQRATFLDTPGHAAFSNMRSRGAHMTDLVVLVVSADDGVMPQTAEAIEHARSADVPIIVAINKCDKPGANPQKIREGLLKYGVQVEDMGGDVQVVEISALKGTGIELLVENIVLLAEVLDLRAPTDGPVEAAIIESQSEKGRGLSASLLIQNGSLSVGDIIVAGQSYCRIRSMTNDLGKAVKIAEPGTPVSATGWKDLPEAGQTAIQVESESLAKEIIENRIGKAKQAETLKQIQAINAKRLVSHEEMSAEREAKRRYAQEVYRFYKGLRPDHPQEKDFVPTLRVLVKGDVSGTVEAVVDCLQALPQRFVHIDVVAHAVGPITESDIQRARGCTSESGKKSTSSNSSNVPGVHSDVVVIGFNVKADKKAQALAKSLDIPIETHRIIYRLLEDIRARMVAQLEPEYEEHARGEARVLQRFAYDLKRGKVAHIAGCRVTSGIFYHDRRVRVMRGDQIMYQGLLASLRSGKEQTTEVSKGQECGMAFNKFEDFKEGDVIFSLESIEKPRKLE
ncbi:translation initiation factor IF-2 [Dimargaris cristalligena]|uniref:Translation initiation factor IF-2, chloroplastic n=1 Tax=Dimargaris cristalligena TaxID=215637 RepID=A0A4V1J505_9FUNG|nr:translation initiation factor IF-2 [Dimargaris cristalligena]|eukprot:RKP37379.1 translation initiation factor IF-2 [Dimargaris cristalligena]